MSAGIIISEQNATDNPTDNETFNLDNVQELFVDRLPSNQTWRIFPEFRESTAYLDIETRGLDFCFNEITTIALYDGKSIFIYVQGQNLGQFKDDIQKYKVIVTYNGKCFDVPFSS